MILVTGASGFIGRSVVAQLQARERQFRLYSGRINDPRQLRVDLEGAFSVVHLAGSERRGRARVLQHVDVEGTSRLIEECSRAGVKHIFYLSRLGADPNSIYPLLRAKGDAEQLIRTSGLDYTILRSATAYGRHDYFLNVIATLSARSWPFMIWPSGGTATFQPLWVEDLAMCIARSLEHPKYVNKVLDIGGEDLLRYQDIVRLVLGVIGIKNYFPLKLPAQIVRPGAALFYGIYRKPLVSRFFMDHLAFSETVPPDSVLRQFGFRPAQITGQIGYLRKSPWRWRMTRI